MDRSILLKSLPFLYEVSPSERFLIWNQHWEKISQHHQPGNDILSDDDQLFPCHSLSIETVACGGTGAGVAFFSNARKKLDNWNITESHSSSTAGEMLDPALSRFKAYLLPAQSKNDIEKVPQDTAYVVESRRNEHGSPVASSASTSMTKSQSPKTPSLGQREECSILYFVVDQDIFCVDHRQIRSIEIQEGITENSESCHMKNSKDTNHLQALPMSLLFTFDAVVFRVFYDHVVTDADEGSTHEKEAKLQQSFLKLKRFMLAQSEKMTGKQIPNQSFGSYLETLSPSRLHGCTSPSASVDENGQTSNDAIVTGEARDKMSCGNLKHVEDASVDGIRNDIDTKDPSKDGSSLLVYLSAYDKSWDSVKSIHSLLKLRQRGNVVNDLNHENLFFGTLCNQSAVECMKSYVWSEHLLSIEESEVDAKLTEIEDAIDRDVHKIFPAKGQFESQREVIELQPQIELQLSKYKKYVTAKHRTLGFIPKR